MGRFIVKTFETDPAKKKLPVATFPLVSISPNQAPVITQHF